MNRRSRRKNRKAASRRASGPAQALAAQAERALNAGQWSEATALYRQLVARSPDVPHAWANLGTLALQDGRTDEAENAFMRALELAPGDTMTLANLANLKNQMGERDAAIATYRRVLELTPGDAEIWHSLARLKTFEAGDADLLSLERLNKESRPDSSAAMYSAFALAKAYEDTGAYDKSFAFMAEANRLKRQTLSFDLAHETRVVDRMIAAFDPSFFAGAALGGGGAEDDRPVLVIGMPRSGTTLVEQIISAHSAAFGAGEVDHLRDAAVTQVQGFPEGVKHLATTDLRAMGEDYAARLCAVAPTAKRVVDKMPRNYYFAGLAAAILPNATIVHCRRSPMDTCLSCFALDFPYGQAFAYDLAELGGYYLLYRRLMDHWHRELPGRILDITYEHLIRDPEAEARRLIAHCGLEWEDGCLDFHKTKRQVATASAAQVREPIYDRSVARWRRFGAHLDPLRHALGAVADESDGG